MDSQLGQELKTAWSPGVRKTAWPGFPESAASARRGGWWRSFNEYDPQSICEYAVKKENADALTELNLIAFPTQSRDDGVEPLQLICDAFNTLGLDKALNLLDADSIEDLAWRGKQWQDRILGLRMLYVQGLSIVDALNDLDAGIAKEAYLLLSGQGGDFPALRKLLASTLPGYVPASEELRELIARNQPGANLALTMLFLRGEVSVTDAIKAKVDRMVSSYVGSRTGCRFIRVERRGSSAGVNGQGAPHLSSGESQWFESASGSCDPLTHYRIQGAKSYWGEREISKLERHLADPAPAHTLIAGWNDDGWISTDKPEVIYYMNGIDFYPCDCTEDCDIAFEGGGPWYCTVPAQRLYEELADSIDAREALHHQRNDAVSDRGRFWQEVEPAPEEWASIGLYDEAVRRGTLTDAEAPETAWYGRSLSDDYQKRTWLSVSEPIGPVEDDNSGRYLLSQENRVGYPDPKQPSLVIEIKQVELEKYLSDSGVWPSWLPAVVLFSLFEEEIVALGPEVWAQRMGLRATRALPFYTSRKLPTLAELNEYDLPPGHAWESPEGGFGWIVDNDVPNLNELWLKWAKRFPDTGLWPIARFARENWPEPGSHTWQKHWDDPYTIPNNVYDYYSVDYETYRDKCDPPDWQTYARELLEDLGREVELRLAPTGLVSGALLTNLSLPPKIESLILVPCHRPADAALALDFGVPNDGKTPGIFTGVLRSWEERFGVVPVELDVAWTTFQVLAPPSSQSSAELLANEVALFAWDSWIQGGLKGSNVSDCNLWGSEDFQLNQLDDLVKCKQWSIWWD